MTSMVEGRHTGEFLVSEADGTRSRDEVTVTQSGAALVSGTVMAKLTASGKYVPYDNAAAGSTGAEVAAGVLYTPLAAKTGDSKAVVIVRDAEVYGAALTGSDSAGVADLKALGVIVR